MTRLYIALGIVGLLLVSHGFAYLKGRSDVSDKARIEQLQRDLDEALEAYEREQLARRLDAQQVIQDRKDADLDADFAEELRNDLKDPHGAVFDGADSDGLRDYAAGKHKAKSPGAAK